VYVTSSVTKVASQYLGFISSFCREYQILTGNC